MRPFTGCKSQIENFYLSVLFSFLICCNRQTLSSLVKTHLLSGIMPNNSRQIAKIYQYEIDE